MSVLWTSTEAQEATRGRAIGVWSVTGISIDTRTLQDGDLFVPLKDIRDGHDFIPKAYECGAGAVISEHPMNDVPSLIVKDSLLALQDLARAAVLRSTATRIAVTGSVGKTSVKEALAQVFTAYGQTHRSMKSFNNHWGVPLSLASMPRATDFGIFELGMNHKGELLDLSGLVKPQTAIVTKIAPAHLEFFKSVTDIAKAKAEIFAGMAQGGTAILPADSPHFPILKDAASHLRVLSFGRNDQATARIYDDFICPEYSTCKVEISGKSYRIKIPLSGTHHLENAAVVLLTVYAQNLPLEICLNILKKINKIAGRGMKYTLDIDGKKITLIDESYNANPESMAAALRTLGGYPSRKIAVLGDMLELGQDELGLHADIYDDLVHADVDKVYGCGPRMKTLYEILPKEMAAGWAVEPGPLVDKIQEELQDGDVVMAKGSNASGISKLVEQLKTQFKAGHK